MRPSPDQVRDTLHEPARRLGEAGSRIATAPAPAPPRPTPRIASRHSRRPRSRPAARQAGFTLVETLVCLALAGLIGVLLLNAVRVAGGASAVAGRAVGAEDLQSVRDHLRRTLGSLAQRRPDGSRPTLRGGPDGLVAVVAPDQTLERPTELAVALARVPGRDGADDLLERRTEAQALPGQPALARSEVVLQRIAGLGIRYFGAPSDGARPLWHTAWSRPDRPPTLIEIQIAFPPADRRRWPPLLIALDGTP
ncbi:MAG: prepilin-type N-terminal cleavage/methylation domain-containing protein [Methylobacterium sp.]|uniref:prepilin-type N-terminal cleavage/methylation domain-containing protein n=1 Tax=Methylobacterium sp. TaxID=409 RepID=UPI0025858790|nr:prepilin-type N-terminal cleavage/methylation domain-containing protein [Methylobacterium sp.]MBY0296791.1 prepilin-type N-terminal cleavage/methylation domain-containing protein [Methylobacterium sp.]